MSEGRTQATVHPATDRSPRKKSRSLRRQHRVSISFFKYLCTLCSGSLLVMVKFYDRLKAIQPDVTLLKYSVGLFLICLMTSLVAHMLLVMCFGQRPGTPGRVLLGLGVLLCVASFVGGISCFGAFAFWNA